MRDRDELAMVLREDSDDSTDAPHLLADTSNRSGQHHERERRRRRKQARGRRAVVLLVALALVGGAAFGAYSVLFPVWRQLTASNDYPGSGQGSVEVTVATGASTTAIGRTLERSGVVKSASSFVDAAGTNPDSQSIQPGTYTLHQKMSGAAALRLLLDPTSRSSDQVTLREGLRAAQVVELLAKASGRPVAEYTKALEDGQGLGLPAAAKGKAEGWLFPDTYDFGPDSTPREQLATMVAHTVSVLDDLGVPQAQRRGLVVKASIVQAEGGSEKDFGKVARVIDNRLAGKLPNGGRLLQMDSTVAYGTGKFGIFTTDAQRADKSNPYNTYARPGLPIGPIDNPGEAAIRAVLHPTPGDWLYFVVVNLDTGETKFTTSKAEHDRYTKQFQAWYAKNR